MGKNTSRIVRWGALALFGMVASGVTVEVAQAADSEAWKVYQEFVAQCETATSMEEILPFLPKWRHKRHEKSDEADRKATLERLCKDGQDYQDISFVSEKTKGDETVLQLKAKSDGFPMKGKVTVVREKDGLKIEEWFWATGE